MFSFKALGLALAAVAVVRARLDTCPDTSAAEYDYVVVGAGAGGGPLAARLAESGFTVLVIDVGHDVNNFNTTLPAYVGRVIEDPQIELNYTLDEYPPGFKFTKDDTWYPRGRAIGGSAIHNAVINLVTNTRAEFAGLQSLFNDDSWSLDNMWDYFKLIEKNEYIPLSPDHGYGGWMTTNTVPVPIIANPKFLDANLPLVLASLLLAGPLILDINSRPSIDATGVSLASNTITEENIRSSVRGRLLDVQSTSPDRLQFALDTLVTKVLLCQGAGMDEPMAYGVEIAEGQGLPVQVGFPGKQTLQTKQVLVKREVIVAAGVFQIPQLLMLSGIGDSEQLTSFGIDPIVHLPGVGQNLQDHDEIATTWTLQSNFSLFNGCTFGSDPSTDPCLQFWLDSGHQNLYSFGAAIFTMPYKTSAELEDPDMMLYWIPGNFPGFVRGVGDLIADTHNAITAIALRARPSSRGTVKLTGSDPQDPLKIDKQHFQAPGGAEDVAALRDGVKRARSIVEGSLLALAVKEEIFPGANFSTDEQIEQHAFEHIFGHHACCTAKMGTDSDEFAVLDGQFNVRNVSNLRVVDMSAWPVVPGFFVTTPMYMMSEKAARLIIEAANGTATGAGDDTFVSHTEDALRSLLVFLISTGISVSDLLRNLLNGLGL